MLKIDDIKIKNQFFLIITLAIILIILVELYFYFALVRMQEENIKTYTKNSMKQFSESINITISSIKKAGNSIS